MRRQHFFEDRNQTKFFLELELVKSAIEDVGSWVFVCTRTFRLCASIEDVRLGLPVHATIPRARVYVRNCFYVQGERQET